jgi:predicted nucleic acid-binding Zn ribbon protein
MLFEQRGQNNKIENIVVIKFKMEKWEVNKMSTIIEIIPFKCPVCSLDFDPICGFLCDKCQRVICLFCSKKISSKENLCKECEEQSSKTKKHQKSR